MNRPDQAVSYRAVFRLPGIPRAFTAAILGRLSYATIPLSLLVTIQQATGSYASAGTCLGAYAIASIAMPIKSRLTDHHGPRRVLPFLAGVFAAVLLAVAFAGQPGTPVGVFVVLSAAAGLAAPPLGPVMRGIWASSTPDPESRQRAYSLDSVVEEVLFAAGPLLAGVTLTLADGRIALLLTASLNLVGAIGMATSPVATRSGASAAARPLRSGLLGPLRHRGFALLAVAMLGIGMGSGPLEIAIIARTQEAGEPGASGYLLAVLSVGSAIGGLVWGRCRHRGQVSTQLGPWITVAAAGTAAAAGAPTLVVLAVVLVAIGAVSTPTMIVAYLAADDLVPQGRRTEATTWVNTSTNVGIALGAAVAGALIDGEGAATAFVMGALILALTATAVLATRARLSPPDATHDSAPIGDS